MLPEHPLRVANFPNCYHLELQVQYSNFKSSLQQIAQKIGDVEQETEEHKYALHIFWNSKLVFLSLCSQEGLALVDH